MVRHGCGNPNHSYVFGHLHQTGQFYFNSAVNSSIIGVTVTMHVMVKQCSNSKQDLKNFTLVSHFLEPYSVRGSTQVQHQTMERVIMGSRTFLMEGVPYSMTFHVFTSCSWIRLYLSKVLLVLAFCTETTNAHLHADVGIYAATRDDDTTSPVCFIAL